MDRHVPPLVVPMKRLKTTLQAFPKQPKRPLDMTRARRMLLLRFSLLGGPWRDEVFVGECRMRMCCGHEKFGFPSATQFTVVKTGIILFEEQARIALLQHWGALYKVLSPP
mmetsp:Transcript_24162/g.48952  ORF Transcript_24162/g.48952 Transcript_24162/m.48952 type:complete len:111 (+) Transcript_24162:1558-1890(+)